MSFIALLTTSVFTMFICVNCVYCVFSIPYQLVVCFNDGVCPAVNTFFVITVLPLRLAASSKGLTECNDGCAVTKQWGVGGQEGWQLAGLSQGQWTDTANNGTDNRHADSSLSRDPQRPIAVFLYPTQHPSLRTTWTVNTAWILEGKWSCPSVISRRRNEKATQKPRHNGVMFASCLIEFYAKIAINSRKRHSNNIWPISDHDQDDNVELRLPQNLGLFLGAR